MLNWLRGKRTGQADRGESRAAPPDLLPTGISDNARSLVSNGRVAEAMDVLNAGIGRFPGEALLYADRGTLSAMIGQLEPAAVDLEKAIAAGYAHAATWASLGTVQSNLARPDKAFEAFAKSIELDPGYAFAYYNRAQLLAAQGDHAGAFADLEACLALGPDPAFRAAIETRIAEIRESG